jgi:uncharacterized membrane protein YbhN (UPF0104 family)
LGARVPHRLADFAARARATLGRYRPARWMPLAGFYLVNMALSGLTLAAIVSFWNHHPPIAHLIAADAIAFLLGAASMIPMGVGLQDASMFYFLTSFELDRETAVGVIALQRAAYVGLVALLGAAAQLALGIRHGGRTFDESA